MPSVAVSTLFCLFLAACAHAYTWAFENNPAQCQSLRVKIQGDDGQPPFRLLLLPYGAAPGQYETRYIQTITFNTSDHLDFQLNYPSNSQFVAVVGDSAKGFASGGTSKPWTVRSSSDNSCFDSSKIRRPKWPFFYMQPGDLRSCEQNQIYWNASNPNITGTVNFVGVYPGGQSFNITSSPLINAVDPFNSQTTGFNWTVPLNPGADIILVSGDEFATGTGGSVKYTVSPPQDASHVNCFVNMPSMTSAPYAGGDPSVDLDKKSTNIGAIAGGAAGGALLLIGIGLGVWFLIRRRREQQGGYNSNNFVRPEIDSRLSYIPQPYPMSEAGTTPGTAASNLPPHSPYGSPNGSGAPLLGPTKSRMPQGYRNAQGEVQYVQHQDVEDINEVPLVPLQTVDLPPQYNPSRGRAMSSSGASSSHGGSVVAPSTTFSATSTTLRPSYYDDKKRPPSSGGYGGGGGSSSAGQL